jgi:hypothetical protein
MVFIDAGCLYWSEVRWMHTSQFEYLTSDTKCSIKEICRWSNLKRSLVIVV